MSLLHFAGIIFDDASCVDKYYVNTIQTPIFTMVFYISSIFYIVFNFQLLLVVLN